MSKFKLVLFHDGRRIEKPVTDPAKGVAAVKQLREQGIKCKLVGRTETSQFPPPRTVRENRESGKWWCPYCRDWTYFKLPRWVEDPEIGSVDWMRNAQALQSIRTCAWCYISEVDWYVRRANDLWEGSVKPRRVRKKRR